MPIGSFGYGCTACAYQIRSIGAQYTAGDGGSTDNMVAYVNGYDITTVPWGDYAQYTFSGGASQTCPDGSTACNKNYSDGGQSDADCAAGACPPQNGLLCVGPADDEGNCTIVQCPNPIVQRSQYLIPFPMAYYVIAYGTSISAAPLDVRSCGEGGYWLSMGCIYPIQATSDYPLLVDLPIPDNTLDDTILVQNYSLGIIVPGVALPGSGVLAAEITFLPNLSSLTPSNAGVAGFGPSWAGSISTSCHAPTDDPFTGSDAP